MQKVNNCKIKMYCIHPFLCNWDTKEKNIFYILLYYIYSIYLFIYLIKTILKSARKNMTHFLQSKECLNWGQLLIINIIGKNNRITTLKHWKKKNNPEFYSQICETILHDFKTYYKVSVVREVWYFMRLYN